MITSNNVDMGYNGSYMLMPLQKTKVENGIEFTVKAKNNEEEINKNIDCNAIKSLMGNLDDIRRADSNHDNIISLNELKMCDNKSEFMEHLIFELEQFEKTWRTTNHR